MRSLLRTLLVSAAFVGSAASAQSLELPQPSPSAKVMQRVGLTDVTVEYSSPGVKGRPVWGALVPYDQPWRTGANSPTKVTFSQAVKVGGKDVPAGTYSLLSIPGKASWTLILNKNLELQGTRGYKQEQDVARVTAKPSAIPLRERLTFLFSDFSDDKGKLDLEWEKVRVSLPFEVGTAAQAKANLEKTLNAAWQPFNAAARYNLANKGDLNQALAWADKSIQLNEHWYNTWTKAEILAAQGKFPDALAQAQKANELGSKSDNFFFAEDVKKAIETWKKK